MADTEIDLPPLKKAANGRVCGLLAALHDLKDADRVRLEALMHALANPDEYDVAISMHIAEWGIYLSDQTIRRHRTGRCSCRAPMIPERNKRYDQK